MRSMTLNLETLAEIVAADPDAREQLIRGLHKARAKLDAGEEIKTTSPLGFINLGDRDKPDFKTLFVGTVQNKQTGAEGLLAKIPSGERIVINCRDQKPHQAETTPRQLAASSKPQSQEAEVDTAAVTQAVLAALQAQGHNIQTPAMARDPEPSEGDVLPEDEGGGWMDDLDF